ncbi:MAG: glycosyltransferase [bacterium]
MEGKLIKKIKILFTIPNFNTAGSGKALFKIAAGLNRELFLPSIMCTNDRGELFETIKNSGIPVYVYNYRSDIRYRIRGLQNCYKVSKYLKSLEPDLIHSFHYNDDYSEAISARLSSVKWVYSKKNMMWNSNAWKLRTFLANGIIALNSDMINNFFKDNKKVTLIPRGVDLDEFSYREKSKVLMEKLNLNIDDRILLCVANFVPVKDIATLIEAFDQLSKEHENLKLIIAGDYNNPYGSQLISKYTHLINAEKLILPGKTADTKQYYNLADFFILPTNSRGEGTSVSILEAMASSCVVLASNVPGNKDQLKLFPEQLFEPEDSCILISKINEFLLKPNDEISRIKKKQKKVVTECYTLDKEIEKHEQFYLKILNKQD